MARQAFYLKLAIEGIQKYIFATGKLKEMIGGSEIISYLISEDFYRPILEKLGLEEDAKLEGAADRYIVAQAGAGALCLILPDLEKARQFLAKASEQLLRDYPGLPFYGGIGEFAWSNDKAGRKAYSDARRAVDEQITEQRNLAPVPSGSGLLPILRASRLDGLPAVERDGELISLPSHARRNQEMIRKSRERLRKDVKAPVGLSLEWAEDLTDLLGGESGKIALICMDGNDLGKLFGAKLREGSDLRLLDSIGEMKKLSAAVESCNRIAFNHACERIAEYEAMPGKAFRGGLLMPLRPLVMGGDDITIIARADIALAFVSLFADKFAEAGKAYNFSLGIGMVVMDSSYPFAKAFPLAESLQDSAKKLTKHLEPGQRPSSLDYLVLTGDVENNIDIIRQRLFTAPGGEILTGKPFVLDRGKFETFLEYGRLVLDGMPRSQVRDAWTQCRKGQSHTRELWLNLKENIARGIGGRMKVRVSGADFEAVFPGNFFQTEVVVKEAGTDAKKGEKRIFTRLGDYLELARLMPGSAEGRDSLLRIVRNKKQTSEGEGNVQKRS